MRWGERWDGGRRRVAGGVAIGVFVIASSGSRGAAAEEPAEETAAGAASNSDVTQPAPMSDIAHAGRRLNLGSLGMEASGRWSLTHASVPLIPDMWRDAPESDLRLNVETGRWEVGALTISTTWIVTPERERLCYPDCSRTGSSVALRLKYDLGDLGPFLQIGPELEFAGSVGASDPLTRDDGSAMLESWTMKAGFGFRF
jgi:hypothetical protein